MHADFAADDRSPLARTFDVCIIGAGPAGITLALRLAAAGASVALMEAGGEEVSAEAQALYEGENRGLDYWPLDVPRLCMLGGSTNHWGGWCRALDPVDFAAKPWNPLSGWPVAKRELDPYRAETDAILDLVSATEAPDLPIVQSGYDFTRFQFRWSVPATNFRDKYGPELRASERIALWLNANLVDLRLDDARGRVVGARFRSLASGDPGVEVAARGFVLCCGGLENPRLLPNFTAQVPEGIGNRHGLVGRYFCEHPHFVLAEAVFRAPAPTFSFFAPTEQFLWEHEVLNFGMRIEPAPLPWTMQSGSLARAPACEDPFLLRLAQRVYDRAPSCDPDGDGMRLAHSEPTHALSGNLRIAREQALDPDSRVLLVEDRDALGLRRAALDWRLGTLGIHTQRTAILAFARHLAEQDIGRARVADWLFADPVRWPVIGEDEVAGKHHMGTTRMADDPRHGVVDRHCRVHGLANLWIGGSSVFPTGGHANPTYTLIQLILRLGDDLAAALPRL